MSENKAELIRQIDAETPGLSAAAVAAKLKTKGIAVSNQYVSTIRSAARRKGASAPATPATPATSATSATPAAAVAASPAVSTGKTGKPRGRRPRTDQPQASVRRAKVDAAKADGVVVDVVDQVLKAQAFLQACGDHATAASLLQRVAAA